MVDRWMSLGNKLGGAQVLKDVARDENDF